MLLSRNSEVVCNASPLIHLAKAGQLSILKDQYQEIQIPREVFNEVCGGAGYTGFYYDICCYQGRGVRVVNLTDRKRNTL